MGCPKIGSTIVNKEMLSIWPSKQLRASGQ